MRSLHHAVTGPELAELRAIVEHAAVWHPCESNGDIIENLPGTSGCISITPLSLPALPDRLQRFLSRLVAAGARELDFAVSHTTLEGLRYETGVGLAIHNDYEPGAQSGPGARLVICFCDQSLSGGEFEFYTQDPDGDFTATLTCDNAQDNLVGFVIGPDSFHAVQPVTRGTRYSLVINLFKTMV